MFLLVRRANTTGDLLLSFVHNMLGFYSIMTDILVRRATAIFYLALTFTNGANAEWASIC